MRNSRFRSTSGCFENYKNTGYETLIGSHLTSIEQPTALLLSTGWRKKRGQWAILSNCKYSENSMTEFRGNW